MECDDVVVKKQNKKLCVVVKCKYARVGITISRYPMRTDFAVFGRNRRTTHCLL